MARPNWEWIKLDVLMPEHPKVEGLSDKAFRALVELWCYAGRQRTDGVIAAARWRRVPLKVRAELITARLASPLLRDDETAGVTMHDFTEHQRTREEIDELAAVRTEKAKKAAAARWGKDKPPLADAPSMLQALV